MPLYTTDAVTLSSTALVAQVPNNAVSGGNARGANAVDLQTVRSAAAQVASGATSVIAGGTGNTVTSASSTIAGGEANSITTQVAGTIAGGSNNTTSGAFSTIGGGRFNNVSGWDAVISGGGSNTASGTTSWIPGGRSATTRGIAGRGAWSGNLLGVAGDAQCGEHHLLRQSTSATPVVLTTDNAAPSTGNIIALPNFALYSGVLTVVAKQSGASNAALWRINVSAFRANGVATTVLVEGTGTGIAPTASTGTVTGWSLAIAADTTNGGISVTATGAAAATINWSARYANVEVTTAS